jgi:hypothetical protein
LAAGAVRRSCCQLDNHLLFPEFCAKSEKWFRHAGELFRRGSRTKQYYEQPNDFNPVELKERR